MAFWQREQKTLNLAFSDHVIRYVELKTRSPLVVQQYGERFLNSGVIKDGHILDKELLRLILEDIVEESGMRRKPVRFIVPDSLIAIRKQIIPSDIKEDELKGYLFLEIGTTIHLPFENPLFDVYPLPQEGEKREVLLVATEESVVESYKTILEEAKLKPKAADISPLSLYRLYHAVGRTNDKDHFMLLHFDQMLLTISIFHQHIPVFMRPVPIIKEEDVVEVKESSVLSSNSSLQLEDLLKDVTQIMSFYQYNLQNGNHEVNRILVSGDHPSIETFRAMLADRLDIEIELLFGKNASSTVIPNRFSIPLGLALKEVH
ncbi:pilus assembly protein PilM [Bacillus sp. FJAT-49736]|uniref:type IV pilus biogenesis protein PilM n=1 Tax=Bacillus sp. FJAT-49736 TaxID=2833582 RepID=UPI001BC9991E|nr:pilus assembly protein PilM [Bacillus sp. FJAT-49736]MBS4173706.1 pilus assembly protein PilM [Bacillus sp. FJAT-49736]